MISASREEGPKLQLSLNPALSFQYSKELSHSLVYCYPPHQIGPIHMKIKFSDGAEDTSIRSLGGAREMQ